jgi:hypothetical protein
MTKQKPSTGGRPAKDPMHRLSLVLRAKVTPPIGLALAQDAAAHGFPEINVLDGDELPIDYLRLCVWEHLNSSGAFTDNPELEKDPTWSSLRLRGMI